MARIKFSAVVPGYLPTTDEYMKAIIGALDKTANLILQDFKKTTATWEHKPDFSLTPYLSKGNMARAIGTNSLIYHFVDHGTKAHRIEPKRSKYLAFQSGYRAKTRVGIIGSQEGGAFGDTVIAQGVDHPGFPGRKFVKTIGKRRQVTLQQEVSHSIALVNRKQK